MPQPTSQHSDEPSDRFPSQKRLEQRDDGIDIEALADRVYRLMREEVRLERARGVAVGKQRRKR